MKHTDFYTLRERIKTLEIEELRQAVIAHGGTYEWDENTDRPIVAMNPDNCAPGPMDVEITKVCIIGNELVIEAVDKSMGSLEDCTLDDIFDGQISYIIDLIPEINGIDDVTIQKEISKDLFVLVQFPEDASYFEDNDIGYPCCQSEDNGAHYVPESEYIKVFARQPDTNQLFTLVQWPESQELMEKPDFESYGEAVMDEKGLNDFICPAYWVLFSYLKSH
jgi:hypothetical protein